MNWIVITVSIISTVLASISLFIYVELLYGLFISRKLKKSPSLTLFYVRFAIDALFCLGNLIMLVIAYIKFSSFHIIVDSHSFLIFHIAWPIVNLMSIRAFLVIIITLDRTFAVFFPVSYHNYRIKISNLAIIIVAFSYCGVENMVFWVICDYTLKVSPGCITLDCIGNMCYLQYFISYEMIAHGLIALLSLLLVIKIFIWNKVSNSSKSKDLTRANFLALIDTSIIFVFDIIPAILLAKFENVQFDEVGPVLSFTKMGGYALEGYLVIRALKRKDKEESGANPKSLSIVRVQSSNAT